MAISKKSFNYQEIINELGCSSGNTTLLLKKLKRNEFIRFINFYGTHITLILMVISSLNTKSGLFTIGIIGMPIGAMISIFFNFKANSIRSLLDNEIFNNFLIKKIKIFYPNDNISDMKYTQMKQISVSTSHSTNEHQAIIELAYQAYQENATGILITDSNQQNVVTSTINNKAGATAITKTVYSASAMLINNIENIKKTLNKEFDLEYWYDLFEKGAISEDEYKQKKEFALKHT